MTATRLSFSLSNSAGDTVSLAGSTIYVTAYDGLGLVKPQRFTRTGPQQHGQTLGAALLGERVVTLHLVYQSTTEALLEAAQQELQQLLNELTTAVYLDVTMPSGMTFRLDCYHKDGLKGTRRASGPFYWAEEVLQLVADEPTFYNGTPVVEQFALGGGGTGMPIPLLIPMTLGASSADVTQPVTYAGTWRSEPQVRITGPITDAVIENLTTDEKLDFTGTTIADGDYYDIDCRYGYKTVTDKNGDSQLDDLTNDSDLATFHLAPHAEAPDGINDIRVAGAGINSNAKVSVTYYTRYIGI